MLFAEDNLRMACLPSGPVAVKEQTSSSPFLAAGLAQLAVS